MGEPASSPSPGSGLRLFSTFILCYTMGHFPVAGCIIIQNLDVSCLHCLFPGGKELCLSGAPEDLTDLCLWEDLETYCVPFLTPSQL